MPVFIVRLLYLIIALLSAWQVSANGVDSNYIRKFPKKNQIRVYAGYRNAGFRLENQDLSGQSQHISYEPNARSFIGAGVSFWQLGLSLSIKLPDSKNALKIFGRTNYHDYSVALVTRRFGGNLWFRNYQGLYINNPDDVYSNWGNGDPLPQRKDISYKQFGGDAYWVFFTKRFSMNSCMKQSEQQIKSAGSILLMGEAQSIEINSDSTIIPASLLETFNNYRNLQGLTMKTFSLCIGYAYCFVYRSFFLCPSAFIGPGFINQDIDTESRWIKSSNAFTKFDFKLHLGINIPNFFAGMRLSFSNNISNCKQLEIQNSFSHLNIFGGVRF